MLPPGIPASFDARMDPIPAVGEHTSAILKQMGYSTAEIARLRDIPLEAVAAATTSNFFRLFRIDPDEALHVH